ncbi:MAG: acyl-CoA dehydrogenase [Calditrichaeota bacterium]|nr:MAG: acyl-CoA dehydrogenase [Calditrichota bacterium]MBL1205892.1 acyl-CoA dehydrogenase [Calditrichota bacterium]NOG45720.1 acyl-CoA dehydrogenase [Calditrichota bacterium]
MKDILKGGEFLIKEINADDIFIPEEFDEEQNMMFQTAHEFTDKSVFPVIDQLDKHDRELLDKLMKEAGEIGLLGVSVPEEYDGFGQSFLTSMRVVEAIGKGFAFSVAFSAHTGISTLPILYFGNEEQKKKYIPKLASGEHIGAYCLTEPDAGSDANSGTTKAVLSDDGKHYILNGVKMWITNGGIANILTVFAKIDDDKNLSAFIVERNSEGVEIAPDEEKMGIQGSSTTQIFLEDVKVPVENLLGERGNGFKIALYILNFGRIKLAGATIGACKNVINESVRYSNERKQFGQYISSFPAMKYKMAEQVIRTFANESLTYRISNDIENATQALQDSGMEKDKAIVEGIRQFGIEASISKVFGSEMLDYVVDEGVQIYGGMGYSQETQVEKAYRDSRINRIFEGTNEINRTVIIGEILKRGMKGEIDLLTPAKEVAKEIMEPSEEQDLDYFSTKKQIVSNFKKTVLLIAGAAMKKYQVALMQEQELLFNFSNIIMQLYTAESVMLRVQKLSKMYDENKLSLYKDILDVWVYDASFRIYKEGIDAINSFAEGDENKGLMMGLKRFTKVAGLNVVAARRRIADKLIEDNKYNF